MPPPSNGPGIPPSAYLAKPYHPANVRIAIELAINNFAVARQQEARGKVIPLEKNGPRNPAETADKEAILQMNDCIFVKNNYAFVKIRLADILYIEAENNYIQQVTAEKSCCCAWRLANCWKK